MPIETAFYSCGATLHSFEPYVHLVEPLVHFLESTPELLPELLKTKCGEVAHLDEVLGHFTKPSVYGIEPCVHGVKPRVHGVEPHVH